MTNIPQKVNLDMIAFIDKTVHASAMRSYEEARAKAKQVMFEGAMHTGITLKAHSKNDYTIRSDTEQGMKFETGFSGWAPFTPLLHSWAQKKGNKSVKKAVNKKSGIPVNFARSPAFEFIKNSRPTSDVLTKTADRAFKQKMTGGIIHG